MTAAARKDDDSSPAESAGRHIASNLWVVARITAQKNVESNICLTPDEHLELSCLCLQFLCSSQSNQKCSFLNECSACQ